MNRARRLVEAEFEVEFKHDDPKEFLRHIHDVKPTTTKKTFIRALTNIGFKRWRKIESDTVYRYPLYIRGNFYTTYIFVYVRKAHWTTVRFAVPGALGVTLFADYPEYPITIIRPMVSFINSCRNLSVDPAMGAGRGRHIREFEDAFENFRDASKARAW